jgi:hypothetical protein
VQLPLFPVGVPGLVLGQRAEAAVEGEAGLPQAQVPAQVRMQALVHLLELFLPRSLLVGRMFS